MYFGSETPEEDSFAYSIPSLRQEGNLIDTADVYVGGVSEQIIERWFAARPRDVTDRVVLASKGRCVEDRGVRTSTWGFRPVNLN
jgi:aryl-alcohol dehydrogenase-like predicted oxidoreductase